MATNVVYVAIRPFKSVGIFYPVGSLFDGREFYDPWILRLGRCRISDGYLMPVYDDRGNSYKTDMVNAINARVGMDLTNAIDNKFTNGNAFSYEHEYLPPEVIVSNETSTPNERDNEVKIEAIEETKSKVKVTQRSQKTKKKVV